MISIHIWKYLRHAYHNLLLCRPNTVCMTISISANGAHNVHPMAAGIVEFCQSNELKYLKIEGINLIAKRSKTLYLKIAIDTLSLQ